jgi:hypothetical protein
LDGEKLFWEHYLGILAVLMGVYLINRPGKPKRPVQPIISDQMPMAA